MPIPFRVVFLFLPDLDLLGMTTRVGHLPGQPDANPDNAARAISKAVDAPFAHHRARLKGSPNLAAVLPLARTAVHANHGLHGAERRPTLKQQQAARILRMQSLR